MTPVLSCSVKNNPPSKDGLNLDDCERIITSLLLEKVLATNPVWNAYEYVRVFLFVKSRVRFATHHVPSLSVPLFTLSWES
jgi:hypothetical protein